MTAIEVYRPAAEVAIPAVHDTDSWVGVVADVIKVANVIFDTPFVPDGLRGSAPAVAAAILAGREMGIGPMTSLQHIHVIKGKPAQSALLMRALIQGAGHKWEDGDVSDIRAVVRGCRKGESSWAEVTFTADQARKAGIDLGKYPADKLYARATSRLARRKFADVIAGMPYTAEELEDGEAAEGTVTESPAVPAAEPKPRTAQRKQRTTDASPAQPPAASPGADVAAPAPPPVPQGAGEALPPLPGEEDTAPAAQATPPAAAGAAPDDTDYNTPGTATSGPKGQLTKIWATLSSKDDGFAFPHDAKDQARAVCAHIVGRDLASSKDLSFNEARTVIDTLSHWKAQASAENTHPYDYLIAVMAAEEEARHA
jgi:hypothetical protein